ncbi:nuclear transport factor 2 family protein [Mucilaginibacter rigui]|uniref:Nuclear transport factor 2 family protein n=1 Tax=Mucilaginibacter rigui TaxID=534635 RepID=A0ABR7X3H8_9SPHI|nr:nuclear transport factor 2 family protein [Mucilaginibacter rigui]MBD1384575.1 nuclear transport factor 2 family protein [Mucilaginibacter rigui]
MTITLRRILFIILATAIAACNNQPEKPAVSQTEQSKQLIDEHFRYLNDHDLKSLIGQYADKAKITTSDWDGESYGPPGADQIFHQLFYVSPDAKYLVDNMINTDSTVVVEYDVVGLKEKVNSPIRYDLRNCSIFKIKNNKIVAEATYSNARLYHNR